MAVKARYFKVVVDDAHYNTGWNIATIEEFQVFGPDGTTNLALNKTATESGHYGSYIADRAVDGTLNDTSKWASQHELANPSTQNVWWKVDLGQVYKDLTTAKLSTAVSGSGYAALKSYRIFVSEDNSFWALVYQVTNTADARRTDTISLNYPQNMGKPMARWTMQDSQNTLVPDSLGTNNGTASSSSTYARRFNGTSDFVSFNNKVIGIGAKTIRFRFKASSAPTGSDRYVLDNIGSGSYGYRISITLTTGTVKFLSMDSGNTVFNFTSTTSVCDNKWHEIMLSFVGTTAAGGVKLYIDGVLNYSGAASRNEVTASSNLLYMGRHVSTASNYLLGDLDDVFISNSNEGNGTVVAWWKMDDSIATSMADSSTNAYAATITGTTVLSGESTPIIASDGQGGFSRYFNSLVDKISFTSGVLPLGAKSIRFKVRIAYKNTTNKYIIDNANASTSSGTSIRVLTTGRLEFRSMSGSSNRFSCIPTNDICDGQWHDILCSWDGTLNSNGVKVYIDDMVTPAATATATVIETSAAVGNLMIGAASNSLAGGFLFGNLKDIQINIGIGTERTDPLDLQVGDFISASYTGASNVFGSFNRLGAASDTPLTTTTTISATPNGSFYFICVNIDAQGRKVCIADRNIQGSISWDALNTAGITSYAGIPLMTKSSIIPYVQSTDSTSPDGGIATSSSQYSAAYRALFAFDGSVAGIATGDGGWVSANTSNHWLEYAFPIAKVITGYSIAPRSATVTASPKNWTFEAYDESTSSWVVLDTKTNVTSWVANVYNYFTFSNAKLYKRYRINITANNGNATYHTIGELRMFENLGFNTTIRLLTGGTVSSDTDNEWDKYIVSSSLNGTLSTIGDTALWNWSGVWSTTSTTGGSAGNRTWRGNSAVGAWSNGASNIANGNTNFRPVLIVENSFTLIERILVNDGGMYKTFNGTNWVNIGTTPQADDYISQGMNDLVALVSNKTTAALTMTDAGTVGSGNRYELIIPLNKYGKITGITINKT